MVTPKKEKHQTAFKKRKRDSFFDLIPSEHGDHMVILQVSKKKRRRHCDSLSDTSCEEESAKCEAFLNLLDISIEQKTFETRPTHDLLNFLLDNLDGDNIE